MRDRYFFDKSVSYYFVKFYGRFIIDGKSNERNED